MILLNLTTLLKSTNTSESNYSKKHYEKNIKWENFKKEFNHTIFGPKLTPQQKAQQRAEDIAFFKKMHQLEGIRS